MKPDSDSVCKCLNHMTRPQTLALSTCSFKYPGVSLWQLAYVMLLPESRLKLDLRHLANDCQHWRGPTGPCDAARLLQKVPGRAVSRAVYSNRVEIRLTDGMIAVELQRRSNDLRQHSTSSIPPVPGWSQARRKCYEGALKTFCIHHDQHPDTGRFGSMQAATSLQDVIRFSCLGNGLEHTTLGDWS